LSRDGTLDAWIALYCLDRQWQPRREARQKKAAEGNYKLQTIVRFQNQGKAESNVALCPIEIVACQGQLAQQNDRYVDVFAKPFLKEVRQ
jgi:hypothetical protein